MEHLTIVNSYSGCRASFANEYSPDTLLIAGLAGLSTPKMEKQKDVVYKQEAPCLVTCARPLVVNQRDWMAGAVKSTSSTT